jgi:hypothetical protein
MGAYDVGVVWNLGWCVGLSEVLLLYGYVVGMKNGYWVVWGYFLFFFRKGWLNEEDRAYPVPTHYTGMGL